MSVATLSARAAASPAETSGHLEPVLARALPRVVGADAPVPLRDGRTVGYANFDYAASAPCLEAVQDAVARALPYYSSVHRGAGYASQVTTAAYEAARETVRTFLGAGERDSVVFTRNTTDAMNLLARSVPQGTTVVVFETEHHATLLPWRRAVRLTAPATPAEAVAAAERALADAPAGPRLLVVTAASNVTGELWPIAELAGAARRHGARIAVDAAQLVPHRPLDMARLGLDYVAFSGHKLYAPFGAGVLAGRADWLRAADPYLKGGGASAAVTADGTRWQVDPQARHEAGTPNVLGAIALAAACEALAAAGWDALAAHEERLLTRLRAGIARIPGVRELTLWGGRGPRVGIVSFVVDGWNARDVALTLSEEHGIGVRDGKFCAHPFVRHLLAEGGAGCADAQGSAVRASLGLGSTEEHVDRLLAALARLAA
ncbi:aminotransferase class V-fold PLP-dependent enzyme [Actinomadura parmotrematis]|uniref:Aminotransferase class V-fold PLP-dependent enzyme n=1 Tax=Actinomadura parmotrematis TaxID=2864039 RepID=A0ABS7G1P8_9ACTN|nr:aminotransferase class V-fold PLP-dependent enzyme [Actinomadura parmotrematis]MBW8486431.1 aminotransferase class V-fold PLP-dependent enzyme [Actinomadura parmotrematis]